MEKLNGCNNMFEMDKVTYLIRSYFPNCRNSLQNFLSQ